MRLQIIRSSSYENMDQSVQVQFLKQQEIISRSISQNHVTFWFLEIKMQAQKESRRQMHQNQTFQAKK